MENSENDDKTRLTFAEARKVWTETQADISKWIAWVVRAMAMPVPEQQQGSRRRRSRAGRAPSVGAVRLALLDDLQLAEDIAATVGEEFFRAVERGKVYAGDDARGFLYRVTERRTWKVATKRAKELLRTLEPAGYGEQPVDMVADMTGSPEDLAAALELAVQVREIIVALDPIDREILVAIEAGAKDVELAERFNLRPGSIRSRLCRVRRLFAEVLRTQRLPGRAGGAPRPRRKRAG